MKNRFYLSCLRDNVGGNVAFHSNNGYVTDVQLAKTFTREEAQKEWDSLRDFDVPISADHVDALTVSKVDCQHISSEHDFNSESGQFVAFKRGAWSGNDVYWRASNGFDLNIDNADIMSLDKAKSLGDNVIVIPAEIAQAKKRKTFAYNLFNRRIMTQGAGIKKPSYIERPSRSLGKARFNCPVCGKIHWQFNSHDFEGCNDLFCDGHLSRL